MGRNLGARGRARPDRHTTYFDLLEAAALPGCLICHLAKRTAFRYLDMLSYENVNDPPLRATLRAGRGFCNHHAWQFVDEMDDGLGTAIIYRDIVGALQSVLTAAGAGTAGASGGRLPLLSGLRSGRGDRARDLVKRLAPRGQCPACHQLDLMTRVYIGTLLDHLNDPQMCSAVAQSTGLCLPHLRQALDRAKAPEQAQFLARITGEAYARLAGGEAAAATVLLLLAGAPGAPLALWPASSDGTGEAPDALVPEGDGCPLCLGVLAAGDARLHGLASAGDEAVGRLCNAHAARYLALGLDGDGVWARLLAAWAERLLAPYNPVAGPRRPHAAVLAALGIPALPGPGAELAMGLAPQAACPVCLAQADAEQALSVHAGQGQHGALCLSHFQLGLLTAADAPALRSLAARQGEAFQEIIARLTEFIRKRDYRFTHEPPGEEADSPERAVALVAGARGLRGVGELSSVPPAVQGGRLQSAGEGRRSAGG